MVIGYFKLILMLTERLKYNDWISKIANLTFGIYLIHMMLLKFVLWKVDFIMNIENYAIRACLLDILTLLISASIVYLISLTSFSSYYRM